jgi:hypothetical protein
MRFIIYTIAILTGFFEGIIKGTINGIVDGYNETKEREGK